MIKLKNIIRIKYIIFLCNITLLFSFSACAGMAKNNEGEYKINSKNYLVLADDSHLRNFFRDDKAGVIKLAEKIAAENKGVIIHLGNKVLFEQGGDFYYTTSKENLKNFCDIIKNSNKKVYLWFLDSYGNESFLDVYKVYLDCGNKLKNDLISWKINYDGIVLDIEWINESDTISGVDNSEKYLEILTNLKKVFLEKELMVFVPYIDSKSVNLKRGYNEDKINALGVKTLSMLYVKDGGFNMENGYPEPELTDTRVDDIRKYLYDNNYSAVMSIEKGVIVVRNNKPHFIRNITKTDESIYEKLVFSEEKINKYYTTKVYSANSDFLLKKNDGTNEQILKDEKIFIIEMKRDVLSDDDFIWEYFKSDF